jgi:hypothetical protein
MNIDQRHKLAHNLQKAMYRLSWPTIKEEPNYVAQMVKELPAEIKKALEMVLPGHAIAAGGAFIHQKPLAHFVRIPCPKSPEIGDLLLVCRETRASGTVYNALILQAKCVKNPLDAAVAKSDEHQFILYSEWPEFEYRRAGILDGQRRDVLPKTITQGAQYLLIDKNAPEEMLTATVDKSLKGSKLFARLLASVLSFDMGRTFDAYPVDGWSRMIVDLLWLTANSVFNRRNAGFFNEKRWNGSDAFNFILNSGHQGEVSDYIDKRVVENDKVKGMGVICIDLGSNGQNTELDKE